LAPFAVKFGSLGEVGPLRAVALCRVKGGGAAQGAGPVVVTVAKDCIDLYNAITGERPGGRTLSSSSLPPFFCSLCSLRALVFLPHSPAPAGDRKLRLKRPHAINCADVRADTIFGFLVALGTEKGEVVLLDAATLR
jgi:hypothetical protein